MTTLSSSQIAAKAMQEERTTDLDFIGPADSQPTARKGMFSLLKILCAVD